MIMVMTDGKQVLHLLLLLPIETGETRGQGGNSGGGVSALAG